MYAGDLDRRPRARLPILAALSVALCITAFFLGGPQAVSAQGPTQTVAHWDYSQNCVTYIKGTDSVENLTKDTLPNEWFASWPYESLYAGAELIRTNCIYFNSWPEGNYGLCNQTGQFFHWRDSRQWYVPGSSQGQGRTNYACSFTNRMGWKSNGSLIFYEYNSCYQYKTRDRANAGQDHITIIRTYYDPDARACGLSGHTGNVHQLIY